MEIGRLASECIPLSGSMSAQVEKAFCMLEMHHKTMFGNGTAIFLFSVFPLHEIKDACISPNGHFKIYTTIDKCISLLPVSAERQLIAIQ